MKKNNHQVWRFLYKLHCYIGISSAIVLIMLSITGIALNHTEDLELDSQMIATPSLLDWYGINSPDELLSFSTHNHWITQVDQQVFFDHTALIKSEEKLLGAIETEEFIITALSDSILLLSLQGELIEQNSYKKIQQLGIDSKNNIIIKSKSGVMFSADGLLTWNTYDNKTDQAVTWSKTAPLPSSLSQAIKNTFRSSILPLERVLLDLHSGRFFGMIGVIIVDISGVFLIILSLSGCAIWVKHRLRKSRKNR